MSNDLISRNALVEGLKKYCGNQPYLVSENIWEIIKSQPAAYDVDKVVERLEEHKKQWLGAEYLDGIDEIIEIVKAGGVNE